MPLIGNGQNKVLEHIRQLKHVDLPEEVVVLKNKNYRLMQEKGVAPMQAMVDFAKELASKKEDLGIKVGLASGAHKEEILHNLKLTGLESFFDVILSGADDLAHYHDPEGTNKPKPYVYLEAAKLLGVCPEKCLVFEDTKAGVESAVGAGMIAIAVPNRLTLIQDFSQAKAIVLDAAELTMEIIEKE